MQNDEVSSGNADFPVLLKCGVDVITQNITSARLNVESGACDGDVPIVRPTEPDRRHYHAEKSASGGVRIVVNPDSLRMYSYEYKDKAFTNLSRKAFSEQHLVLAFILAFLFTWLLTRLIYKKRQ